MKNRIPSKPFNDQNPGTSGLRKKVKIFQQPNYVENFIQSIFDCLNDKSHARLVIGGDGRYYNDIVIQKIIKMAVANEFSELLIARNGILSTPAASHIIRKYNAIGGIILSASHNPGGPNKDFGIKFNISNGGPAPEKITAEIYRRSQHIDRYYYANIADIDLSQIATFRKNSTTIKIIDAISDYADLMENLFDFPLMQQKIEQGLQFYFDAMNAVTGPYAQEIFVNRLNISSKNILNSIPLTDFGGRHPDPNIENTKNLHHLIMGAQAPDLAAASDGDGDRNLILGRNIYVNPSDSLAIIVHYAPYIKAYKNQVYGVARSMPTSMAVDHVAKSTNINVYETPTGWKFFGNLLDSNKITFCGEESFGTGSSHIREKDGLWAILYWLNILCVTGKTVEQIVQNHWALYGRNYYSRHDYEEVDIQTAQKLIDDLRTKLPNLKGQTYKNLTISHADEFCYHDPIDGSQSKQQGIRIFLTHNSRIIFRLSGTGTQAATLRLYLEYYEEDKTRQNLPTREALQTLVEMSEELAQIKKRLTRSSPSIIT